MHNATYRGYPNTALDNGKAGYTLFVFCISRGISRMFSWNTPQNTKHSLYTFRISGKFRILLLPRKNKPQNPKKNLKNYASVDK